MLHVEVPLQAGDAVVLLALEQEGTPAEAAVLAARRVIHRQQRCARRFLPDEEGAGPRSDGAGRRQPVRDLEVADRRRGRGSVGAGCRSRGVDTERALDAGDGLGGRRPRSDGPGRRCGEGAGDRSEDQDREDGRADEERAAGHHFIAFC
ncbi:hypothetical protein GCM10023201_33370 [Actinomycetospora corticicola]